MANVTQWLTWP